VRAVDGPTVLRKFELAILAFMARRNNARELIYIFHHWHTIGELFALTNCLLDFLLWLSNLCICGLMKPMILLSICFFIEDSDNVRTLTLDR